MPPTFAVRLRAYAAAHFEWDQWLTINWPDARAILQSEYTGGDDGRAYPVTLHVEVRGEAETLQEAEIRLSNSLGGVFPTLALAANAAIAHPLRLASHGVDLADPQPFLGYQTPESNEWFPPGIRRFDRDATVALLAAVGTHPQRMLALRSIESYRHALAHWFPEEQLLAGEFLFIASEALSRFMVEARAAARDITPKNLARLNGHRTEATLRRQYLSDEVFAGDPDALSALESASNGFEHGYMSIDDVLGLLTPVLERSFGHVRSALIRETSVDEQMARRLLAERYEEPRALVPAISWLRGELSRIDDDEPPPSLDVGAIELEWTREGPTVVRAPDGKMDLTYRWSVRPKDFPANTKLRVFGFGLRAAHMTPREPAPTEPPQAEEE